MPLVQAVHDVEVLLPSNATITAEVIVAPDPAAGGRHRQDRSAAALVALPHIAGRADEAFTRIVDVVIDSLDRVTRGDPVRHRVG